MPIEENQFEWETVGLRNISSDTVKAERLF